MELQDDVTNMGNKWMEKHISYTNIKMGRISSVVWLRWHVGLGGGWGGHNS